MLLLNISLNIFIETINKIKLTIFIDCKIKAD